MIQRFANLTSRLAILGAFLFILAACGGGGGGSSSGGFIPDGGTGDAATYIITLELFDPDGQPTNTVTSSRPATLKVTVSSDAAGTRPVEGEIVEASLALATLIPESGSALTNENGVATFEILSSGANGADTVTVSVNSPEGTGEASLNYQVGFAGLRLGYFADGFFVEGEILVEPSSQLSPTGTASLIFAVVDENGERAQTEEQVSIRSECLAAGDALLDRPSPVLVTGQTTVSYTAAGCEGEDRVLATLAGSGNDAFGTVSIAPLTAQAISFESAVPDLIVLKGTGGGTGRQESSTVTFNVVDSDNNPVPEISVDFSLSTEIGGVSLGNTSGISNEQGQVKTTVFSGNVATAVRVFARIEGSDVTTTSDVLVVTTGLPDQNSVSLSVGGNFVVENGFTVDGITRQINVRMADKFNNPVPDGTSAIFSTEYGSIEGSCTLTSGSCSVTWTSQEPRVPTFTDAVKTINDSDYSCPSHSASSGPCPDDLGEIRGGRSTIVVTALGEETFIDQNGNGLYDEGEPFQNLPEAFIDHNEDGVYTPAIGANCPNPPTSVEDCEAGGFEEIFADLNNNNIYDLNDDPAVYNGTLCPPEGDGVFCSRELVAVSAQTVVILSADPNWDIGLFSGRLETENTVTGGRYTAYIADVFNNKPVADSKVDVDPSSPCTIEGVSSFTVPNTTATGAFAINFEQGGKVDYDRCADDVPDVTGTITIRLTPSAGGPEYSETFSCQAALNDTSGIPPDNLCPDT